MYSSVLLFLLSSLYCWLTVPTCLPDIYFHSRLPGQSGRPTQEASRNWINQIAKACIRSEQSTQPTILNPLFMITHDFCSIKPLVCKSSRSSGFWALASYSPGGTIHNQIANQMTPWNQVSFLIDSVRTRVDTDSWLTGFKREKCF